MLSAEVSELSVDVGALCANAARLRSVYDERRSRIVFRGREVILRDVAAKLLAWLDMFKQIGDVVVDFNPDCYALPWASVDFLLNVSGRRSKSILSASKPYMMSLTKGPGMSPD